VCAGKYVPFEHLSFGSPQQRRLGHLTVLPEGFLERHELSPQVFDRVNCTHAADPCVRWNDA
jgi:hypothetical protein